ncbi:hypothetical protein ACIPC1_12550 [Streptomyces sp. NPDC087263]|uniref:hypothetical protein n=1 Tax=Streptomyces sp. NPDC087263 TaxID=3365773 RepID=UPI003806DC36
MYDATATLWTLNGRGGGGGIDIKVTGGQRVRIFQLRYYPDGFPTASFNRRRTSFLSGRCGRCPAGATMQVGDEGTPR